MKTIFTSIAGLVMLLMTVQMADAQGRLSWELRTGVDFATEKLGDVDLNTGFGFEGSLVYRFMPHLSSYTGWGWHRFTSDNSFAGSDMDFEETGYTFGLLFMHPLAPLGPDYFIRAGGLYNHIEIENSDGDINVDSGHGFGWQAGAGLAFDVGKGWRLMPGVRYRSLSHDIEIENVTIQTDLNYVELEVGISRSF